MHKLKNFLPQSKILTIAIAAAAIILIISCQKKPSDMDNIPDTPIPEVLDTAENEQIQYSSTAEYNEDPLTDKNIVNILLIGQDKRSGEEENSRSDSMIISTVNKKNNSVKLISLMRDMYVNIPDYGYNKINAAYAFGGMDLLDKTVENNFLVNIDGCVEVDFSGFEKIIDKIGGVDIELNKDEAYYLSKVSGLKLTEGKNRLNGEIALEYARIRYIGNNDYERTERQRNVLVSVFNEVKASNLKTLIDLANDIMPLITTNLTSTQILGLVTRVVLMDVSDIGTYRIPADGTFTPDTIYDMSVLVPDLTANRELIKEYMGY